MSELSPRYGNLLKIPEAAARLRVSESTVWRWVYSGRLPSVKLGKSRRIRAAALERFIEEGETPKFDNFLSDEASADREASLRSLKPFTFDNPLWKTVGMFKGDGAPVSENIHYYVGEAIAAHKLAPRTPGPAAASGKTRRATANEAPKPPKRRAHEPTGRRPAPSR